MKTFDSDLIVIAGGASRRMGVNKALLPVPPDGTPLVRHVIDRLSTIISGQTIIVANDPTLAGNAAFPPSVKQVPDDYPGAGALGGLATGLARCNGWAVCVACDLPLVDPNVFALLADHTEPSGGQPWDAIVPQTEGYPQPLHALYHRRSLPAMQTALQTKNYRIISVYDAIHVRYIEEIVLRQIDPKLHSFLNVNTPEDWQSALASMYKI